MTANTPTHIPDLPENSIHPPQSENPSPADGLRAMGDAHMSEEELANLAIKPCIRCFHCNFTAQGVCMNPYKECSVCAVIRQLAKDFILCAQNHDKAVELDARIDEIKKLPRAGFIDAGGIRFEATLFTQMDNRLVELKAARKALDTKEG